MGTGDGGSVEIVVAVVASFSLFLFVAGVFGLVTEIRSPWFHLPEARESGVVFNSSLSTQFKLAE